MAYEFFYWPEIQGRGEFVRLALEDAGAAYIDIARGLESEGRGVPAMLALLRGEGTSHIPFAPPFLRDGDVMVSHTAAILLYLGGRIGLAISAHDISSLKARFPPLQPTKRAAAREQAFLARQPAAPLALDRRIRMSERHIGVSYVAPRRPPRCLAHALTTSRLRVRPVSACRIRALPDRPGGAVGVAALLVFTAFGRRGGPANRR